MAKKNAYLGGSSSVFIKLGSPNLYLEDICISFRNEVQNAVY